MIKKLIFLFVLTSSTFIANAQNWGGGIDDGDYNWGFSFQYIASEFKLIRNADWRVPYFDRTQLPNRYVTDSLVSMSSPLSAGFGIGFVVNARVNANVDLRFTPSLVFSDRLIDYYYQEPAINNPTFSYKQQKVASTVAEFPLGLKIKSDRRRDFRAYMLMGGKFGYDLAAGKKSSDADNAPIDKILKSKKGVFSYEGGVGFDFYFEYFKMSTEMKVSHSLGNVLRAEDQPFRTPIDRAILRNFTFSLFFE